MIRRLQHFLYKYNSEKCFSGDIWCVRNLFSHTKFFTTCHMFRCRSGLWLGHSNTRMCFNLCLTLIYWRMSLHPSFGSICRIEQVFLHPPNNLFWAAKILGCQPHMQSLVGVLLYPSRIDIQFLQWEVFKVFSAFTQTKSYKIIINDTVLFLLCFSLQSLFVRGGGVVEVDRFSVSGVIQMTFSTACNLTRNWVPAFFLSLRVVSQKTGNNWRHKICVMGNAFLCSFFSLSVSFSASNSSRWLSLQEPKQMRWETDIP